MVKLNGRKIEVNSDTILQDRRQGYITTTIESKYIKVHSVPRGSKLNLKSENGVIKTGNGIISSTSRPLIKKFLLQNVFHLFQGFQN